MSGANKIEPDSMLRSRLGESKYRRFFVRERVPVIRRLLGRIASLNRTDNSRSERVERTVLIAICVVLAVFVLAGGDAVFQQLTKPGYREMQATAGSEMGVIVIGLQYFYSENNRYPSKSEGLLEIAPFMLNYNNGRRSRNGQRYTLLDPWGHPYAYRSLDGGQGFEITSYGADGLPDGVQADWDIIRTQRKKPET